MTKTASEVPSTPVGAFEVPIAPQELCNLNLYQGPSPGVIQARPVELGHQPGKDRTMEVIPHEIAGYRRPDMADWMSATAWSNGRPLATGAGYGLRIGPSQRDRFFEAAWLSVGLELPDGTETDVSISAAFWRSCSEIRSASIGRWMLEAGFAPWLARRPPRFLLEPLRGNRFRLWSDFPTAG